MTFTKFDECKSLIEIAERFIQNPSISASPALLDTKTMNIVLYEFTVFTDTARIFWKGDFNRILSDSEETKALETWLRISVDYIAGKHANKEDYMFLIKCTAKMILRTRMNM